MSWVHKLVGWASGNGVEVDTNNQLKVVTPTNPSLAGFAAIAGRTERSTGTPRVNPGYVTEGGRLAMSPVSLLWDDSFNVTAVNTAAYRAPVTTQTVTFSGGFATLNGSAVTTINTNSAIQSWHTFPLFSKSELHCAIAALLTQAPQANAVTEWGLFSATLPGAAAPTDGVFFRMNAAGELRGVVNSNGTETQTAAITAPAASVVHEWLIVTQANATLFLVDGVIVGVVERLTDTPALGAPFLTAAVPFTARHYIGASAPALATQLRISDVSISMIGIDPDREWQTIKASMGHHAYQGQNGGTMGSTALYANSANPTAAVPTNTTAALGTGLGGQFWMTSSLALGTDGIISSYQNPAGGVLQTPRVLLVYGVTIDATSQSGLSGGPYALAMSLAFGHTNVSLATAESATAKAPRRVALGKGAVTASQAAATKIAGFPMTQQFRVPIPVYPGEFLQVVAKPETGGTVGAGGVIAFHITFDAMFE